MRVLYSSITSVWNFYFSVYGAGHKAKVTFVFCDNFYFALADVTGGFIFINVHNWFLI